VWHRLINDIEAVHYSEWAALGGLHGYVSSLECPTVPTVFHTMDAKRPLSWGVRSRLDQPAVEFPQRRSTHNALFLYTVGNH
jgi:hypothetical protein